MSLIAAVESMIALFSLPTQAAERTVRKLVQFSEGYVQDTALATTTALSERAAVRVKQKSRLVGAWFVPDTAVTGAATNFFTLLVDKRAAALPGTPVNLLTYAADTAGTDDIAAFASKDLMVPAYITGGGAPDATFDFAEGDVATVEVTKAAAGMTFPSGRVVFLFEARD